MQIVYSFPGLGDARGSIPLIGKLQTEWDPVNSQDCWMPWEKLINMEQTSPGAFMGAYLGKDFQLTLWIDQFAQDLFVCYQSPPPKPAPAPEGGTETQ